MTTLPTPSSILVVGSINTDLVLRAGRLPAAGESIMGERYCRIAGGKGANQAVALARLGAAVTFVGKIGLDGEGETLKAQLSAEGVCVDFLSCGSTQTGLAVIAVDDAGENSIVVIPGANREVTEADVAAAIRARSFDALMLQLEIPARTVIGACELAAARGIPVVLDAGPAQEFPLEALARIDLLTPNETETFVLTGVEPKSIEAATSAAQILLHRSPAEAVVLKLGARGALISTRQGHCEHLPAFSVDVVDTTAAGDAFTAALAMAYVESGDLHQAVLQANAAGALAATSLGAQPSLPTARALEAFRARQAPHAR